MLGRIEMKMAHYIVRHFLHIVVDKGQDPETGNNFDCSLGRLEQGHYTESRVVKMFVTSCPRSNCPLTLFQSFIPLICVLAAKSCEARAQKNAPA